MKQGETNQTKRETTRKCKIEVLRHTGGSVGQESTGVGEKALEGRGGGSVLRHPQRQAAPGPRATHYILHPTS